MQVQLIQLTQHFQTKRKEHQQSELEFAYMKFNYQEQLKINSDLLQQIQQERRKFLELSLQMSAQSAKVSQVKKYQLKFEMMEKDKILAERKNKQFENTIDNVVQENKKLRQDITKMQQLRDSLSSGDTLGSNMKTSTKLSLSPEICDNGFVKVEDEIDL